MCGSERRIPSFGSDITDSSVLRLRSGEPPAHGLRTAYGTSGRGCGSGHAAGCIPGGQVPARSRVQLRRAITAGAVLVDGQQAKPAYRVNPGQRVTLTLPDLPREVPAPEPMALDILYEDEDLAAVNKPAGLVVHPSRGHHGGTLVNALAHHLRS